MAGQVAWVNKLKSATKTSVVQDGKRKVHYTFDDGSEMVEEYDLRNYEILVRKWQRKGTLGGLGSWEVEIGDAATVRPPSLEVGGFAESSDNPVLVRSDKRTHFQWRIRNLPFPLENYDVNVEERAIVVRTKNKKYFKKISVPDMDRFGLPLSTAKVAIAHANNTLLVTYQKPEEILRFEETLRGEMKKRRGEEGDVDPCVTS